ncbi:hypothetical protein PVK06_036085 [Gossypium arboreum]|uniref:Reverse transcriptase n=1 Tax=Gossypium arboreum TaxID=29729 RepID=A0ABR0NIK0_GOSAR|nr:hypothetical protein PVK06_036085 [Gossypium arboreum]
MGFRHLSSFNTTLLAKQGWGLLNNPKSLLARALKARYFKDGDFLNSSLGRLPSFTWQSIWAARGLLLKGLGWRIRSGQKASIWVDVWIPGDDNLRIQNMNNNQCLIKVADLVDASSKNWKSDLISFIFDEQIAKRILCIPFLCLSMKTLLYGGVSCQVNSRSEVVTDFFYKKVRINYI